MSAAPAVNRARRPLFEIVNALLVQIAEADGEVTDKCDALELELNDKVEAYCVVIRQMEAEAQALEDLAHEYKVKSATRLKSAESLRARLGMALTAAGCERVNTATARAYFATSQLIEVADPERFAATAEDRFVRHALTINRSELKRALDAGESIPGATVSTKRHLRIS